MRLVIALVMASTIAATSQIVIARVFAQGEAVIELSVGQDDPALEWDIEVAGGSATTDHLTLAPIPLGFRGEFTVAVDGTPASVTLTTVLSDDLALASVGCLDDLTPPREIEPVLDRSSFMLDVEPGRRYSCFVTSLPADAVAPAAPIAEPSQVETDKPLPRSDSLATAPAPLPGWPTVVVALVVIAGIALLLRPARRSL